MPQAPRHRSRDGMIFARPERVIAAFLRMPAAPIPAMPERPSASVLMPFSFAHDGFPADAPAAAAERESFPPRLPRQSRFTRRRSSAVAIVLPMRRARRFVMKRSVALAVRRVMSARRWRMLFAEQRAEARRPPGFPSSDRARSAQRPAPGREPSRVAHAMPSSAQQHGCDAFAARFAGVKA